MKSISAVDLRNNLEDIVKSLKRGERMELTYRGKPVAELTPIAKMAKRGPMDVLSRLQSRHVGDPHYAQKVEKYLREVYEDRRAYGERFPE